MNTKPDNIEVCYPDSNRIGKFRILHEALRDGTQRPMLKALFGLCVVIETYPHESGRGLEYIAESDLFQELKEGEEIPEYRIEMTQTRFIEDAHEARRLNSGAFGFVAVRNFIVRVPAIAHRTTTHALH